jgi:hypothetical protein
MKKRRILVFPCGSEIGLEIHRSLKHSAHFEMVGASSVDDHGRFVYEDYIGDVPFIDEAGAIPALKGIVAQRGIDAIYPAMDKVIWALKSREGELGCRVIASCPETTSICLSKTRTYAHLCNQVKVPRVYSTPEEVAEYPVFAKPDVGYGSRGVCLAESAAELSLFLSKHRATAYILTEYLPGQEYTVDCFTDRRGILRFVGPRGRDRISNGISVHTSPVPAVAPEFRRLAETLNRALPFRGAWFFQAKRDTAGHLTLLEIASRLGGSSALHRALGVNFALLSVFDAFDVDVDIVANGYAIELDRALDNRYKTDLAYSTVYIDLDDTLIVDGKVNLEAIAFLYKCRNEAKTIVLITKHAGNLPEDLARFRIAPLFDRVIHLKPEDEKSAHVDRTDAIFIDDSFSERRKVAGTCRIPVFDVHMIEALL